MTLFCCFAGISLLCVFPFLNFVCHLGVGVSLLLSLAAFLLLHVLYLLFFLAVSMSYRTDRPLEKQNPLCRFAVGNATPLILFYAGIRPVITGLEKLPKDSRFLFVSNHRSMFDPLIVMARLRHWNIAFISKPSNMRIPIAGRVVYGAGFLPIDRENDRNALKTILTAADYMKRDLCSIGVYPEGTRSRGGELLPFHAGCFKAAQRAKVPIVVAAVHGTEKVQRMTLFSGTTVYLDILEVIPAETVCAMRTDELSETIRELIRTDLDAAEPERMAEV